MKELFEPFGAVSVRRMFGAHGIYADGLCFALESGGEVFVKNDAANEAHFAGAAPFTYMAKGRILELNYRRLAETAYDDPDELKRWAALGLSAARRAQSKVRARKTK